MKLSTPSLRGIAARFSPTASSHGIRAALAITAISLLAIGTAHAATQTVTIDFNTGQITNPPATNLVTIAANDTATGPITNFKLNAGAATSSVALLDTTGSASGLSLSGSISVAASPSSLGVAGTGGVYSGTVAPLALAAFPATSGSYVGLFVNAGATVTLNISGLTDGGTYNLLSFIGRNGVQSGAGAAFSITTGVASATASDTFTQNSAGTITNYTGTALNPSGTNGALALGFNNVTASAGGVISLTMADTGALVDIQALQIVAVPEPSTFVLAGLFGFGMLMLFRRRRA